MLSIMSSFGIARLPPLKSILSPQFCLKALSQAGNPLFMMLIDLFIRQSTIIRLVSNAARHSLLSLRNGSSPIDIEESDVVDQGVAKILDGHDHSSYLDPVIDHQRKVSIHHGEFRQGHPFS